MVGLMAGLTTGLKAMRVAATDNGSAGLILACWQQRTLEQQRLLQWLSRQLELWLNGNGWLPGKGLGLGAVAWRHQQWLNIVRRLDKIIWQQYMAQATAVGAMALVGNSNDLTGNWQLNKRAWGQWTALAMVLAIAITAIAWWQGWTDGLSNISHSNCLIATATAQQAMDGLTEVLNGNGQL
jgi:hypothetical protein